MNMAGTWNYHELFLVLQSRLDVSRALAHFSQAFPSTWHARPGQCVLQANPLSSTPSKRCPLSSLPAPIQAEVSGSPPATPSPVTARMSLSFSEVCRHVLCSCSWAVCSSLFHELTCEYRVNPWNRINLVLPHHW